MSVTNVKLVQLPSHFAQVQLGGLKDVVDHHIANDEQVQFDAEEVDRIDGAAVQFLLAVSRLQKKDAIATPLLINMNDVLKNAFDDMGVLELINTDSVQLAAEPERVDAA